jgi:hypothetical protein
VAVREVAWQAVPPRTVDLFHEIAVAKLRLDGTPTPRSRVARMTKWRAPTGVGKSASRAEARHSWSSATRRCHTLLRRGSAQDPVAADQSIRNVELAVIAQRLVEEALRRAQVHHRQS